LQRGAAQLRRAHLAFQARSVFLFTARRQDTPQRRQMQGVLIGISVQSRSFLQALSLLLGCGGGIGLDDALQRK